MPATKVIVSPTAPHAEGGVIALRAPRYRSTSASSFYIATELADISWTEEHGPETPLDVSCPYGRRAGIKMVGVGLGIRCRREL